MGSHKFVIAIGHSSKGEDEFHYCSGDYKCSSADGISKDLARIQSEVVADTINPEWNELGSPIEIKPEYLNEKGKGIDLVGMCRVRPSYMEQAGTRTEDPPGDECPHSGSGLHCSLEAD